VSPEEAIRMTTSPAVPTTALDVVAGRDLSGTVAVVTGASVGLGLETARALASAGARVLLANRDPVASAAAVDDIRATAPHAQLAVVELDLASLAAVRRGATAVADAVDHVDVLVNNAGVMATPFERTADGHERQFGTNHLGHFLFTMLLLPALLASGRGRVVNVSSHGHRSSDIDWDDPDYEQRPYDKWQAYGQSKTANILHALELDTRFGPRGVHAYSVHPGLVATKLGRHLTRDDVRELMERVRQSQEAATGEPAERPRPRDPAVGAATQVWCAVSEELDGHGGAYCEDLHVSAPLDTAPPGEGYAPYARDPAGAARLWELSERVVSG
jgi:NAD(P)-dependent dehydrogenase (short-subunit alcohol dehydrogenase family)